MFFKLIHIIKRKHAYQNIMFGLLVSCGIYLLMYYDNLHNDGLTWNKSNDDTKLVSSFQSFNVNDDDFMNRMEQRMDERRTKVRHNCFKLGLDHNKEKIRPDLVSSEKYKTIFCQIPKTGITHWKYVFTELIGDKDLNINSTKFSNDFKRQHQINGPKKAAHLSDPNWLKMTVVREPFERLVSAYRDKLENPPGKLSQMFAKKIQQEFGTPNEERENPTFSTFVNYLVGTHPHSLTEDNGHWKKYTTLCQPCDLDYDFIGHQETIEEDSKYILQRIGAPNDLSLQSAYKNHTNVDMVLQYYSSVEPRSHVLKLYRLLLDDYVVFGYPPPPVLKTLFGDQYSVY